MKTKIFLGFIFLIILCIFIFYSNCTKNSTRYEFRKGPYLYAGDISGSNPISLIYVLSTETDSVVDSISLGPYKWPGKLDLSPDKRTLYVNVMLVDTTNYSGTMTNYEVDTRTKAVKYIGPNSYPIISPDGRYLFKPSSKPGGVFRIFDAWTHQLVYEETTYFYPYCFDGRNFLVYGAAENGCGVFNYKNKVWVRTINIYPGNAILSLDGNILYFLEGGPSAVYFSVYDLRADSVIGKFGINSPGYMAISPDGKYVYLTDPGGGGGCIGIEPPTSGKIGVFDTETNTPLPSISLDALGDSLDQPPIASVEIEITPDGKKAYVGRCDYKIFVIDLVRNEPLKAIIFPKRGKSHVALTFLAL